MALASSTKIPIGTVLAEKYRITREIGRGGMAAVYEAEHVDIGKRVAIKVLAQELTSSAIVVERFLREARAAAAIRSPYICDVYDSGRLDDGRPFLVLELLEGESLYERMSKVRWLDADTTLAVIAQTCRGLTKAHAANIVHRDLKPENVFLTKDEEGHLLAKILDFGLAKFYAPLEGNEEQQRLTREGAVFGTPAYMSPEQVRGQGAVDHRADLWALGCITYECLTGKTVWSTEQGVAMTFAQIASSPPPDAREIRSDLPEAFHEWFKKALDRNIDKRFQTAKEFAEELTAALSPNAGAARVYHVEEVETVAPDELSRVLFASQASSPGPLPSYPTHPTTPRLPSPAGLAGVPPPPPSDPRSGPRSRSSGDPLSPPAPPSTGSPLSAGGPGSAGSPGSAGGSGGAFVAPAGRSDPHPASIAPEIARMRGGGSAGRAVVVLGVLALAASAAYAGYRQFVEPAAQTLPSASASAVASAPKVPELPDAGAFEPTSLTSSKLAWQPKTLEAQSAIAAGNLENARELLGEAHAKGGHTLPQTMRDHVTVALGGTVKTPCRMTGLARVRTYDLVQAAAGATNVRRVPAGRPSIVYGSGGALVAWSDAHSGSSHIYVAILDETLRPRAEPLDLTPEGALASRPELVQAGEQLALLYVEEKGPMPGTYVRLLEPSGQPASAPVRVSPVPQGGTAPSLAYGQGSLFVAWSAEQDAGSTDLFIGRLSSKLEVEGEPARVTDFVPHGAQRPRAVQPALSAEPGALHLAFRLDREPQRLLHHLRVPVADLARGLPPEGKRPADRTVGDLAIVNSDKARIESSSIACAAAGCFIGWTGEGASGAWVAYVDGSRAQPVWRDNFSKKGSSAAVALDKNGRGLIAYYEQKLLSVLPADTRSVDKVPSRVARAMGPELPPAIAAGKEAGEWYLSWLHYEAGHPEPFAARVKCQ